MTEGIEKNLEDTSRILVCIESNIKAGCFLQAHAGIYALPEGEIRKVALAHFCVHYAENYLGEAEMDALTNPESRSLAKKLLDRTTEDSGYFG